MALCLYLELIAISEACRKSLMLPYSFSFLLVVLCCYFLKWSLLVNLPLSSFHLMAFSWLIHWNGFHFFASSGVWYLLSWSNCFVLWEMVIYFPLVSHEWWLCFAVTKIASWSNWCVASSARIKLNSSSSLSSSSKTFILSFINEK